MRKFFAKLYGDCRRGGPEAVRVNKKLNDADEPDTHGAAVKADSETKED